MIPADFIAQLKAIYPKRDGGQVRRADMDAATRKLVFGVQNLKHGECGTPTYRSWHSMMSRCKYPQKNTKKVYFDRGISVCERWLSYENFRADMGFRPAGSTLDRIDSKGNYEPGNCRWATVREQQNNRTNTPFLTHNGESLPLMEWSRRNGISSEVIRQRIKLGWTESDAVSKPTEARRPREKDIATRKLVRNAARRLSRERRRRERAQAGDAVG